MATFMPGEQSLPHRFQTAFRQGVGEGIGFDRDIRFQQLRQRVHGVGGDLWFRTGRQQVGVEQGVFRNQLVVAEGFFEPVRAAHAEHGVFGRFAAGASGGGHGDERRGGTVVGLLRADAFQIVHHRIAAGQQAGNRLGAVQHAAAADADDDRDVLAVTSPDRLVHELRRRFVADPRLFPADAGLPQRRQQRWPMWRVHKRMLTGDQQHAIAVLGNQAGQLFDATGAKFNTRQAGNGERLDHERFSS